MSVSEATFLQLALEDPEGHWELHCGHLVGKPGMTVEHNNVATRLLIQLARQLDEHHFGVRLGMGHVRTSSDRYYIPDVFVVPVELERAQRGTRQLEVYRDPLPLVVEVWSPSTGQYDINTKLPEYQRRGDLEIWRIHPYDRSLIAWRRQPDGTYLEGQQVGGQVRPIALPNVTINLDALFD